MKSEMRASLAPLLERLRLYNQPQRLMILSCLCVKPCSVSEIEHVTQIGQPALSQQLGELRRAGMIASTREAREVTYGFATLQEKRRAEKILSLQAQENEVAREPEFSSSHVGAQFASILLD